jgi:hypothetical protein
VQLAALDPDSSVIHVHRNGRFQRYEPETVHLAQAASSLDWYRGRRDHLGFAEIKLRGDQEPRLPSERGEQSVRE